MTSGSRAKLLIDSATYFQVLESVLQSARRTIFIIGWDFDAHISLGGSSGQSLGALLRTLVERNRELEIRILIWSLSVIHSPGDPVEKLFGAAWQDHARIQLRLDREHPFYACQHQKIIVADENIAFTGGIDLTVGRWDRLGHRAQLPRINPDGSRYGPVHDVQIMVDGPAAHALGDIARVRWQRATSQLLHRQQDLSSWPSHVKPDFQHATAGISCTYPAWRGRPAVQEGYRLTEDLLQGARKSLYVEAQYFTAHYLADILEPVLQAPAGPEIVLIISADWHSKTERLILGRNCERLLRKLKRADRHGRLLACYPQIASPQGPVKVLVHSKVIIADDRLMRVGSSNLNNRSITLDSECDLTIQAQSADERRTITHLRNRLLAEHLGSDPVQLGHWIAKEGSIIRVINRVPKGDRRLVPFDIGLSGPVRPVFGTGLIDPARPF